MSALLADPSARLRSMVGSILDRSGALCFRIGARLFAWREAIDPELAALTDEQGDRILRGVMDRIACECAPPAPPRPPCACQDPGREIASW